MDNPLNTGRNGTRSLFSDCPSRHTCQRSDMLRSGDWRTPDSNKSTQLYASLTYHRNIWFSGLQPSKLKVYSHSCWSMFLQGGPSHLCLLVSHPLSSIYSHVGRVDSIHHGVRDLCFRTPKILDIYLFSGFPCGNKFKLCSDLGSRALLGCKIEPLRACEPKQKKNQLWTLAQSVYCCSCWI